MEISVGSKEEMDRQLSLIVKELERTAPHGRVISRLLELAKGLTPFASAPGHVDNSGAPKSGLPNCVKEPQYCGSPLFCEQGLPQASDVVQWFYQLAHNGQANVKTWCMTRAFSDSIVKECLWKRDLLTNGRRSLEEQAANHIDEIDASYCFIAGYCKKDDQGQWAVPVANNATLQDGVELCDAKFGRARWTDEFGIKDVIWSLWLATVFHGGIDKTCGFLDRDTPMMFAKLGCAMGNFHCDMVYCRTSYCENNYYLSRYGSYGDPNAKLQCPKGVEVSD